MVSTRHRLEERLGFLKAHFTLEYEFVRHFRWISIGMIVAGVVVMALAWLVPLDAFWILGGGMLVFSGIVKVIILHLWREMGQPQQVATPAAAAGRRKR
jgi:hypothetical protein